MTRKTGLMIATIGAVFAIAASTTGAASNCGSAGSGGFEGTNPTDTATGGGHSPVDIAYDLSGTDLHNIKYYNDVTEVADKRVGDRGWAINVTLSGDSMALVTAEGAPGTSIVCQIVRLSDGATINHEWGTGQTTCRASAAQLRN